MTAALLGTVFLGLFVGRVAAATIFVPVMVSQIVAAGLGGGRPPRTRSGDGEGWRANCSRPTSAIVGNLPENQQQISHRSLYTSAVVRENRRSECGFFVGAKGRKIQFGPRGGFRLASMDPPRSSNFGRSKRRSKSRKRTVNLAIPRHQRRRQRIAASIAERVPIYRAERLLKSCKYFSGSSWPQLSTNRE